MNILGIRAWGSAGSHDASAAIVCDGVLVAAAEQERFSRRRHDSGCPLEAIEFCLRRAALRMDQVDVIAFPEKPFRTGRDSYTAEMDWNFVWHLRRRGWMRPRAVVHKFVLDASLRPALLSFNGWMNPIAARIWAALRKRYGKLPPVRYYDHHRAHAAAAYFTSGHDQATVVTIDGLGGPYASVTWRAEGNRITRMRAESHRNSIGLFYYYCTHYLGLGEFGEGKTMGLAPYGDQAAFAERVSTLMDFNGSGWYNYRNAPQESLLGFPPRRAESIVEPPYRDFAAACQDATERAVRRVVQSALDDAQCRNLCLGGGVMMNCSSNGALLASGIADSVWVFPAAGDSGLSVGAALLCAAERGELDRAGLGHACWGPEFDAEQCQAALEREAMVEFHRAADLASEVAQALATGQTVGWFQGRMELGPRALGNRSILADPRTVPMRDRVNLLKGREAWRPLAPVVLAERSSQFFTSGVPSPFMLFAMRVKPEKRATIPAVVHVDGSARVQTVRRDQNPRLYDLLAAFDRIAGVPVLLNTSFNAAGEPIVCSPADAIRTFLATGLDLLVLGDFVVRQRAPVQGYGS